ncbi:MAG: hypothetical protein JW727_04775 [Candidatus Aenigmarchaeota archaeon]|nr:hypothetical protein [Candidatus Aenigmarchaeota archaeon]
MGKSKGSYWVEVGHRFDREPESVRKISSAKGPLQLNLYQIPPSLKEANKILRGENGRGAGTHLGTRYRIEWTGNGPASAVHGYILDGSGEPYPAIELTLPKTTLGPNNLATVGRALFDMDGRLRDHIEQTQVYRGNKLPSAF